MEKKITIQDIADALDLSRNTVSKALNNTGVLAEDTRQKILEKAAEMGYRRVIYISDPSPAEKGEVKELALITQNMPYGSHFGTYALNTFQEPEYALRLPFRNLCAEHVSGADEQE